MDRARASIPTTTTPRPQTGDGPGQAAAQYAELARGLAENNLARTAKAAAYSEHYLADMHVALSYRRHVPKTSSSRNSRTARSMT